MNKCSKCRITAWDEIEDGELSKLSVAWRKWNEDN